MKTLPQITTFETLPNHTVHLLPACFQHNKTNNIVPIPSNQYSAHHQQPLSICCTACKPTMGFLRQSSLYTITKSSIKQFPITNVIQLHYSN